MVRGAGRGIAASETSRFIDNFAGRAMQASYPGGRPRVRPPILVRTREHTSYRGGGTKPGTGSPRFVPDKCHPSIPLKAEPHQCLRTHSCYYIFDVLVACSRLLTYFTRDRVRCSGAREVGWHHCFLQYCTAVVRQACVCSWDSYLRQFRCLEAKKGLGSRVKLSATLF